MGDAEIDSMNRPLFTFAVYYAGPTRIAALHKKIPAQGLDANKWFGDVELLVSQSMGQVRVVLDEPHTIRTPPPTAIVGSAVVNRSATGGPSLALSLATAPEPVNWQK